MMRNPERGASQVSVLWLILVMIVALAMAVTAWVQSTAVTTAQEEIKKLRSDVAEREKTVDSVRQRYRAVSAKVGFVGEGSPETEVDPLTKALDDSSKALGGGATAQDILKNAQAELAKSKAETEQRDQRIASLQTELKTANDSRETARSELQKQIDDLDRRSKDQTASDAAKITNLETQRDEKAKAAKDAADQLTALQEKLDKEVASRQKELDLVAAKNADLNTKLMFTRVPPSPKGSVVEVSKALPIGYIDLGNESRIQQGMRFQVVDYDSDHKFRTKGWAEVTKVDNKMSEVRLETRNSLSPIVRGDLLLNPLFDPSGMRKAVLVGRFPISAGGKQGVEARLKDLGITIQDKVDATTDYVILGQPDVSNTGEVQDFETNPDVVMAQKLNTIRYSLKDLDGFFRRS